MGKFFGILSRVEMLIVLSIGLTILIEILTIILRFVWGYRSAENTLFIAKLTGGIRIHHLYLGLFLFGFVLVPNLPIFFEDLFIVMGAGLVFSDLIHHFLVLWPLTGSPEFDLTYPNF